jgi:hypothetical protein
MKSIEYANQAGLKTDIYIYPCIGRNATAQINNMIYKLGIQASNINTVWIDV